MTDVRRRPPLTDLPAIEVRNSGWLQLLKIDDGNDGNLCVMEVQRDIPFDIKRVYFITHLDNCVSIRGKHAHRQLHQAIFCIHGSFILSLDDGERTQDVHMYRDRLGVLLGAGLWHTMHTFSSGCVVLVAASDYFDERDYIRDYDEWKRWLRR